MECRSGGLGGSHAQEGIVRSGVPAVLGQVAARAVNLAVWSAAHVGEVLRAPGLYGYTLEIYRGRKPTQISDVEWRYNLDRLEVDPKGLSELFRRQVAGPLDEILEPHLRKWNTAPGKVIRLLG